VQRRATVEMGFRYCHDLRVTLALSLAAATWISAWAAVGAAAGTFFAFMVALWALHKQINSGLKVQAARILLEMEGDRTAGSFVVRNMSDLPIADLEGAVFFYRNRLSPGRPEGLRFGQNRLAAGAETRASMLSSGTHGDLSAVISFRDASGSTWRRQLPSGELRLIKLGPRRAIRNRASYGLLAFFFAGLESVNMINNGPNTSGVLIAAACFILGIAYMRTAIAEALLGFRQQIPRWSPPTVDGSGGDRQVSE
jgi:hypothetical protein